MKKILLVALVAIGMASCKKEEVAAPASADKVMTGKKEDMGEWE